MILVLTTKLYEQGTAAVLDWMLFNKSRFLVVHYEDLLSKRIPYEIDILNEDILIDGVSIKKEVKVIWYRRFYLTERLFKNVRYDRITKQLEFESKSELETLVTYLRYLFKDKVHLPMKPIAGENKLIYLDLAKKAGMKCPHTIVTNSKRILDEFYSSSEEKVISKPIYFSKYFTNGSISYSVQTTGYDGAMIGELPAYFFPTLFQQAVDSHYEVRVFYLNGRIFSTAAIYDGTDRNIDLKMNYKSDSLHWVRYQLPAELEEKIRDFMGKADLNTGSLDFLKTSEGYCFLEVNPVGQYLAPSDYCNYYLDYEISKELDYEHKAS